MLQNLTDSALIKRFQDGEDTAFEELVRRHQQRLYRLAGVFLEWPDSAGDAVQEVFARALVGFKGFLFRAEAGTWLYQTCKNVCREFNRRNRHYHRGVEIPEASAESVESESGRTLTRVRALVMRLPERQREVVMLRIFEDLSVKDTAQIMGCREGTVKALLFKAMQSLRMGLSGEQ